MHGGKAGRKPIHGRYTKVAQEECKEMRELMLALKNLIG